MRDTVRLEGGPFDGETVPVGSDPTSPLLVELPAEPGKVARYRRSRDPGVFRFREYDRIVARIPSPGRPA